MTIPTVLVLCVRNAGRSLTAAGGHSPGVGAIAKRARTRGDAGPSRRRDDQRGATAASITCCAGM